MTPDVEAARRKTLALARNIVNQILDESGASVKRRQAINDRCDEFVAELLATHVKEARAAALKETADTWQWGAWADVLKPPPPGGIPTLAHGQQVTDWLRARVVGAASDGTDRC